MTELAIPTPGELATERDPSKRLLALVEPATNLLVRATAVEQANDIRSQAEAIERYARTIRLTPQAIGAAQTIARRAEVRIGELDEKRTAGRPKKSSSIDDDLSRDQRHDFRQMAEATPTVEAVLGELAPKGQATRAAALRAVKRDRLEEAGETMKRDLTPAAELLDVERSLKAALFATRRMREAGQEGWSVAPLIRRIRSLYGELEGMLP